MAAGGSNLGVERPLQSRDALVEPKALRRKGVRRSELLRPPNPGIPLAIVHFLAEAPLRICSYHMRWCFFAQEGDTSPRITEPNAPRSAAVPIYTWIMNRPLGSSAATGWTITEMYRRKRRVQGTDSVNHRTRPERSSAIPHQYKPQKSNFWPGLKRSA